MPLDQPLRCNAGNNIHQLINRDKPVGTEIQRLVVIGLHEPQQTLDAIIDVHERTCLLAIAPNLDGVSVGCKRDLAGDGRGGFFLATFKNP